MMPLQAVGEQVPEVLDADEDADRRERDRRGGRHAQTREQYRTGERQVDRPEPSPGPVADRDGRVARGGVDRVEAVGDEGS
jgi:hypothetical protein